MARIDIHHHMVPPFYAEALEARGLDVGSLPEWSPELSLTLMDARGISRAVLSVSSPGTPDASLARAVNEYGAKIVREHPDRFDALASLPQADVTASCEELRYALDELQLNGVILLSNVAGRYVGDPELEPLLSELDARGAMVLVHPNDRPGIGDNEAFDAFVEYPADVARAYTRLVHNDAFNRFGRIRWVFANGGGVVPFLAERIGKLHYAKGNKIRWGRVIVDLVRKRHGGLAIAKSVSYDTADTCSATSLRALRTLVEPDQILFGSNYPWTPETIIARNIERLEQSQA